MTDPATDQPSSDPTPKKPRNRRKIIIILVLAFFACGACGIISTFFTRTSATTTERVVQVDPTDKPESSDESVNSATIPTDEPAAEPTATAAEIDPIVYVTGINITPDDLPHGDPGLVVVLAGPPGTFGVVPIVIRNNTDTPAYNIELSATARDAAGAILGTARGDDITPSYVPPGGVAIGRVLFQDTPLDGATIEYNITASGDPGFIFTRRDLVIEEHQLVNGNVVGLSVNNHSTALNLTKVIVMCFDDDLIPSAVRFDFTDQDRVEAGAELPFSVDLLGDEAKCSRYLIAGSGRETD